MAKRKFGIRLDREIEAVVEAERSRRAQASGIQVTTTAVLEALVKERLAQIQQAG